MPPNLSEIERKILDYMVGYLRENTYQPSIREIGERFGIKSTKTVSEHLQALATKGFLERDPSRSRGVKILGMDLNAQAISVPCFSTLPEDRSSQRASRAEMFLTLDRRLAGDFQKSGRDSARRFIQFQIQFNLRGFPVDHGLETECAGSFVLAVGRQINIQPIVVEARGCI